MGFDWDAPEPVWEKIREELRELKEAVAEGNAERVSEELGDVLFSVVNLARFLKADSELALLGCNRKFRKRFAFVEEQVRVQGGRWDDFTLKELDVFWAQAKKQ